MNNRLIWLRKEHRQYRKTSYLKGSKDVYAIVPTAKDVYTIIPMVGLWIWL